MPHEAAQRAATHTLAHVARLESLPVDGLQYKPCEHGKTCEKDPDDVNLAGSKCVPDG